MSESLPGTCPDCGQPEQSSSADSPCRRCSTLAVVRGLRDLAALAAEDAATGPVRPDVVDAILEAQEVDAYVGPEQAALIASATFAEQARAWYIEYMTDADDLASEYGPADPQAAGWSAALPPRPGLLAGLPHPAAAELLMLYVSTARKGSWTASQAQRAQELLAGWTPDQRAIFERRTGRELPPAG